MTFQCTECSETASLLEPAKGDTLCSTHGVARDEAGIEIVSIPSDYAPGYDPDARSGH